MGELLFPTHNNEHMSNQTSFWTTPTQSADNPHKVVIVTGRRDVETFRKNPRFKYRVDVTLPYEADATGMPDYQTSKLMAEATDSIAAVLKKDPVAVMTGIYTGDGKRDWIFYTVSLHIFQRKFNEAMAQLPTLPLEFHAEEDPQWEEYQNMKDLTEIAEEE